MYRIPLTRPAVGDAERRAVLEVLDSGFLTEGPRTRALEERFAQAVGARHAIAVTSCTTGLEIALRALGMGQGDEVLVPDYTYPATATAVALVGARPVVVDVDPTTMLIDLERAAEAVGPRTRALIPVSLFGNPVDADAARVFCSTHALAYVEDAACGLGAEHRGRPTGRVADLSVFSLHPRKSVTTGEGGMITTGDDELAEWIRSFKRFGLASLPGQKVPRFARIGTNAKLSDLQAALGLAQLERLPELLAERRSRAERYTKLLAGVAGVTLPRITPGGIHGWQSFCVFVAQRDSVLEALRARGIEAQIGTYALHREPAFSEAGIAELRGPFPGSLAAFETCLALPLYPGMRDDEQDEVVAGLAACLRALEG